MKILILTNYFPPHIVDPSDVRTETICEAFKDRGHKVRVLTSTGGSAKEYDDGRIARLLRLNNDAELEIDELEEIEQANNNALGKLLDEFEPDVVHVFSLRGVGKSILLQLQESEVPYAMDVADPWLRTEFITDPWLVYWNSDQVSFMKKMARMGASIAGANQKIPTAALNKGKPIGGLFAADGKAENTKDFVIPRLYFCTDPLKITAKDQLFPVDHAEMIHSAISAEKYHGEPLAATETASKFLVVTELNESSRIFEITEALGALVAAGHKASLTIYGQGTSDFMSMLRNRVLTSKLPVEIRKVVNPGKELPEIYREHHGFIYASANAEPLVPAPLQAMASGLPVIINRAFELQEFFKHRENCLFYDSGDIGLLAGRMLELIQDGASRFELAANGQSQVLRAFDELDMFDRVERFLQDTASGWDEHKAAVAAE
ncbi:MAG: glycosyltransferase family 4 protein [Limisphaerales bacterium]